MFSGNMVGPSSAISGQEDSYEEDIPSFVLNMANGAKKSADYNAKDVLKLQELHRKSCMASSELSRSGGVGKIRR